MRINDLKIPVIMVKTLRVALLGYFEILAINSAGKRALKSPEYFFSEKITCVYMHFKIHIQDYQIVTKKQGFYRIFCGKKLGEIV